MSPGSPVPDAALASRLVAVDPFGFGGVALRAQAGPARDRWVAGLRAAMGPDHPVRRVPLHAEESRLFGGLDLTATLAAGRPVAERGIVQDADGGILLLAMAERAPVALAARLAAVLDAGEIAPESGGVASGASARVGIVALDEGLEADERPPMALLDRMAFWIGLDGTNSGTMPEDLDPDIAKARLAYGSVRAGEAVLTALVETAAALGIASLRAPIHALRAARALAALDGRLEVEDEDAALAARLVLAPRATRLPAAESAPDAPDEAAQPERQDDASTDRPDEADQPGESRAEEAAMSDLVLAAARAAIPPGLLLQLQGAAATMSRGQAGGRAGDLQASVKHGRPAGVRQGRPGGGVRLNLIETLRAAAPWQALRGAPPGQPGVARRLQIRRDDLRITRLKQRGETTTLFVVDASGSLAATRLAEAKGAVELLLAECYVRRDQVALLAFRGSRAELLLPPTRSLPRAKRSLAEVPGGGATPLAAAIEAATALAEQLRRRGQTPVVVFLTDGKANVARDGTVGRAKAEDDARQAARVAASFGLRMLVIDAGSRPQPSARALADALKAAYLPLPRAEAGALSRAVRTMAAR